MSRISTPRASGFTLVEAVMSMLIVSVMLVAALRAVSASTMVQFKVMDRARGEALASAMVDEILQRSYSSSEVAQLQPVEVVSGLLGIVGGVLGGGIAVPANARTTFDDVDDYNGYSDSPPVDRDGALVPGCSAYRRQVAVAQVSLTDFAQTSGTDQGVKRITVTITRNGSAVAKLVAVKTRAP